MFRSHGKRGSATVLSTVLALVITVVGAGLLVLMLYMGGQREVKNAVDAGCLNIGKQVLDQVFVTLSDNEPERWFRDVACDTDYGSVNNDNKINLRRINRVWAKALLVQINADAASREGNVGSGNTSAGAAYHAARDISEHLASRLKTPPALYSFFTSVARQNSVRMLGTTATVSEAPGAGWQTSYMERSNESNIALYGNPPTFGLPRGISLTSQNFTQSSRRPMPVEAKGLYFLRGYTPLSTGGGGQGYWQVPFLYDEKPHLVSSTAFEAGKLTTAPMSWQYPVPNAFSAHGKAGKPGVAGEQAMSWVLTNPRQTFRMAMPHSFLRIRIDENKVHWYFYPWSPSHPMEYGGQPSAMTYGYTVESHSGPAMPWGGILCSWVVPRNVSLGMDVVGRSLDEIIFDLGSDPRLEEYMVGRINQMICKVGVIKTNGDLHNCLRNPATIGYLLQGDREFYVFSTNGTDLVVEPRRLAPLRAPWLREMIDNPAEGIETGIIRVKAMAPMFFQPLVIPEPGCHPVTSDGWGFWNKEIHWKPGTGFRGCLGEVRSKRWTDVHSLGICSP